jgi:hypothetical protein
MHRQFLVYGQGARHHRLSKPWVFNGYGEWSGDWAFLPNFADLAPAGGCVAGAALVAGWLNFNPQAGCLGRIARAAFLRWWGLAASRTTVRGRATTSQASW